MCGGIMMTMISNPTMACIAIAGIVTLAWMCTVSVFSMMNTFFTDPIVSKWEDIQFEKTLSTENQAWMFFENLRNVFISLVIMGYEVYEMGNGPRKNLWMRKWIQVLRVIAFAMVCLLLLERRYPFGWWLASLIFAVVAFILLCIHFKRIFSWNPKVQTAEEAGEDFVNWLGWGAGAEVQEEKDDDAKVQN